MTIPFKKFDPEYHPEEELFVCPCCGTEMHVHAAGGECPKCGEDLAGYFEE